jgi:hypothetical protein
MQPPSPSSPTSQLAVPGGTQHDKQLLIASPAS